MAMPKVTPEQIVLAALAPAKGAAHTPVQVQKLLFLLDKNLPHPEGPYFQFEPYHYGPFDKKVYQVLEILASQGLAAVSLGTGNWNEYRLTAQGQVEGERILRQFDEKLSSYIQSVSRFVRSLSFSQLVSAIYKKYPEMREKSVFQD
jgi:uncharacterized protein